MKQLLYIIPVFVLASCTKDIKIDLPNQESKLVVNSVVQGGTAFRATVGKTVSVLAVTTAASFEVNTAIVVLYKNGTNPDTLKYDLANKQYISTVSTVLPGVQYTIKVKAPGFTEVEADTKLPIMPTFTLSKTNKAKKDSDGEWLDLIKLSFTDPATEANYYIVKMRAPQYSSGTTTFYWPVNCISTADPDIERPNGDPGDFNTCFNGEFFLADRNFNGRSKDIVFYVRNEYNMPLLNPANGRTYRPVIEINSITEAHYKYRKSYDAFVEAEDNPFAEPVLIYSNVKNGYGLFGAFGFSRDTLK